ncbi:MAG: iduronate sulfatase, partial [Verrucomicrobiota bacterium]|nr:iduronate sulfatase [Verrucomicrobiota bacterium]
GSSLGYALRNQRWRYARWPDGEELYNLANDPSEKKNLAGGTQHEDRLREFRTLLTEKQQKARSAR